MKEFDVLIIGAGVTGASVARRLARYDLRIGLLEKERDVAMGASKANSAIIHGGYAESHDSLRGRLCYQGRQEFDQLEADLHFGFQKNGSLVLAFEKEDLDTLEDLYQEGLKNGLDDLKILSREEVLAREPGANQAILAGLYCSGAGIVSPYEYVIALCENAIDNGVELFLNTQVTGLARDDQGFLVESKNGQTFRASYLVNAAGLEGDQISRLITETNFRLSPRSGQYILFRRGSGQRIRQTIFQPPSKVSKGILVAKTIYNNLFVGPDALSEQVEDRSTNLDRLEKIFDQASKSLEEGLPGQEFIRSFAGVRAVSSTGDFVLEASKTPGFIQACGIQSPGLTASPAVAKKVEDLLRSGGLNLAPKTDFKPQRPAIHPMDPPLGLEELKEGLDRPLGDPKRIVCRCEQVREEVLDEAFRRSVPIKSLDALKRRTRTSMGFCQGQFCRPRIQEYLELNGISWEDQLTDVEREKISRVARKAWLEREK